MAESDDATVEWSGLSELPVSVVVGAPSGEARQDQRNWRIMGVVAGDRFASRALERVQMRSGPDGDLFLWRGHRLRLSKGLAEDYALNLADPVPVIYVVVQWDPDRGLVPLELTASLGEAQNMDATDLRAVDESVRTTPMPAEVGRWLDAFTREHYVPRKRKKRGKRRSRAIYDAEVGDWAGDDGEQ